MATKHKAKKHIHINISNVPDLSFLLGFGEYPTISASNVFLFKPTKILFSS